MLLRDISILRRKGQISLEHFVCASAGLEMNGLTLVREPAFASFETRFLDGMLRSCVVPKIPCSFGALWGDVGLSAGAIEKEAPPFPTDLELYQYMCPALRTALVAFWLAVLSAVKLVQLAPQLGVQLVQLCLRPAV